MAGWLVGWLGGWLFGWLDVYTEVGSSYDSFSASEDDIASCQLLDRLR